MPALQPQIQGSRQDAGATTDDGATKANSKEPAECQRYERLATNCYLPFAARLRGDAR
jgi:hypothetical protein